MICCFKIDKKLVNFDPDTQSLIKFHFDWSLSCKIYNVWPKNAQRSYLSWHWSAMQNLKKNRLVVWKIKWGIWQTFIKALDNALMKVTNLKSRYVWWHWRMIQNLKGNWLIWKLAEEIWQVLTREFESFKNLHFNGKLLTKVFNVWSKKVQQSFISWYYRVMQNLKKN